MSELNLNTVLLTILLMVAIYVAFISRRYLRQADAILAIAKKYFKHGNQQREDATLTLCEVRTQAAQMTTAAADVKSTVVKVGAEIPDKTARAVMDRVQGGGSEDGTTTPSLNSSGAFPKTVQ